jgi:NADP-dependent 3-hydroxy acid dehydrogenase YdfG
MYNVDVKGVFLMTKAALPYMLTNGGALLSICHQ